VFVTTQKAKVGFIEPMLLLRTEQLPEGVQWTYELKLDGFRALAVKTGGQVRLRSRNDKDFNERYPAVVKALAALPDEVIDGEIVAMDESGPPFFQRPSRLWLFQSADLLLCFRCPDLCGHERHGRTAVHASPLAP
jgi:ATP-dependent DNA ligase